jgi:hypothetical protein
LLGETGRADTAGDRLGILEWRAAEAAAVSGAQLAFEQ